MSCQIIGLDQDMSGAWFARVLTESDTVIFLKFRNKPTEDQIQETYLSYQSSISSVQDNGIADQG